MTSAPGAIRLSSVRGNAQPAKMTTPAGLNDERPRRDSPVLGTGKRATSLDDNLNLIK